MGIRPLIYIAIGAGLVVAYQAVAQPAAPPVAQAIAQPWWDFPAWRQQAHEQKIREMDNRLNSGFRDFYGNPIKWAR